MVKPFLANMTMSELHAILTGGFATIAGSVMAAYISYKVSSVDDPGSCLLSVVLNDQLLDQWQMFYQIW